MSLIAGLGLLLSLGFACADGSWSESIINQVSDPLTSDICQRLRGEIDKNLHAHVLDRWFPASVDITRGGFSQDFNEEWTPGPGTQRSLVFQARLTWVSAQVAMRHGEASSQYLSFTRHGLAFLKERLWDHQHGGFLWEASDSGNAAVKSVYGNAFGIYAAAANYQATRDPAALQLAQNAFRWLEKHAHDAKNGGYREALTADGKPIIDQSDQGDLGDLGAPGDPDTGPRFERRTGSDPIGTPFGQKSMNTHIHVLEALTGLYAVWPDRLVKKRLAEVLHILETKVIQPAGYQKMFFHADWQPVAGEDSFGHDIETAFLVVEASEALSKKEDPSAWRIAKQLVDHSLAVGEDQIHGGIYDSGSPEHGPENERNRLKVWWVQAEALNAILLMHEHYRSATSGYAEAFLRQWKFIAERQTDHVNLGWFPTVTEVGERIPGHIKSDGWTDAYHQARALMNVSDRLEQLAKK
jgi:mannobiose 2-epimerase